MSGADRWPFSRSGKRPTAATRWPLQASSLVSPAAARLLIFETRPHLQTLIPCGEHCKTSDLITQERASGRKMGCESGGSRVVSLPLMLYLLTWQEKVNGSGEPLNVMMMGSRGMNEPPDE